jgi:hypothetical protein
MGTSNGAAMAEVEHLCNTAWAAIGSATMDGPVKDCYWSAWTTHCRLYPDNDRGPHLPPSNIRDMLLTFAVAVREEKYGLGRQVKVQSVAVAPRSVAQKYVLDGHPNPCRASPAQHALDLPIARILKRFDDKDPAPEPKLAVPVSTIIAIASSYHFTNHHAAVADMIVPPFPSPTLKMAPKGPLSITLQLGEQSAQWRH